MCQKIWKAVILLFVILRLTRAWTLKAYKGSLKNTLEVNPNNATRLIDENYVNLENITLFYTYGFLGNETIQGTPKFIEATLKNTNWSVVLVNWAQEASPGGLPNYYEAAQNSQTIGMELGQVLSTMVARGLDPNKTMLVGFSLGGQMFGRTGYTLQNIIQRKLRMITALDPAGPLFDPIQVFRCIKSTDARYVLVVHTDTLRFGAPRSHGTHDFYPNLPYYRVHGHQPGCNLLDTLLDPMTLLNSNINRSIIFCDHLRAVDYMTETVMTIYNNYYKEYYNCTIIGNRATSASAWQLRGGSPLDLTCLGYNAVQSPQGNYFCRTNANANPVYGLGIAGTVP